MEISLRYFSFKNLRYLILNKLIPSQDLFKKIVFKIEKVNNQIFSIQFTISKFLNMFGTYYLRINSVKKQISSNLIAEIKTEENLKVKEDSYVSITTFKRKKKKMKRHKTSKRIKEKRKQGQKGLS